MHSSASPCLKLPPELILTILLFLPNISTLQSIVLSHSNFYVVYRENRDAIITHLLTTLVSAELLPQALAVRESAGIQHWTTEKVARVLARYRDDRRIVRLVKLSLADLLHLRLRGQVCVCGVVDAPLHGAPGDALSIVTVRMATYRQRLLPSRAVHESLSPARWARFHLVRQQ